MADQDPNTGTDNPADGNAGGDQGNQGAQGGGGSFIDSLPEELKTNPTIQKFDSLEGLAKSYVNLQGMLGKDKIPIPETEEQWNHVYNKLGRPEDPMEYGLKRPEIEGTEIPKEKFEEFLGVAHRLGLNAKQVEGLLEHEVKNITETLQAQKTDLETRIQATEEELRKTWGEKFTEKKNLVERFTLEFADDDLREFLRESGLQNDPRLLKLFSNIADKIYEESGIAEGKGDTIETIEEELSTLRRNPAFLNGSDPMHKSVIQKINALEHRRVKALQGA